MWTSIARIVENFKQNWSAEIDDQAILAACAEAQHRWRERELGPIATVRMFLLQILWGNTACNHVPHLAGRDVTGGAYCEARARLPLGVFQSLLARCTAKMADSVRNSGCWLGHRLWMMDGSSFSMSDTPELQEHFGQPGGQAAGGGFPGAHWLALVHCGSGLIQQVFTAPLRTHDLNGACAIASRVGGGRRGDRRPGFGLFCPRGAAVGARRVRHLPRASEVDCGFHAVPCPCAAARSAPEEQTLQRYSQFALGQEPGAVGPDRGMVSPRLVSELAVGGSVRRVAGHVAGTRAALPDRAAWLSREGSDAGDDTLGCAAVFREATGRSLWPLAGRLKRASGTSRRR